MSKINTWIATKYISLKNRQEEAQGLAEYGLILALIAAVCIGALIFLGGEIDGVLRGLNFTADGGGGTTT